MKGTSFNNKVKLQHKVLHKVYENNKSNSICSDDNFNSTT